jgi:hypothetical protein
MAIGFREWRPRITQPPIQIVRFSPKVLNTGIKTHVIESVPIRIYSPALNFIANALLGDCGRAASCTRGAAERFRVCVASPRHL